MKRNKIEKFKGKKVAILGYGIENEALVEYISKKKLGCEVHILNRTGLAEEKIAAIEKMRKNIPINLKTGEGYDENLKEYDIISRVAGYPLFDSHLKKAADAGSEITSPTILFFSNCQTRNIIGVTGTKGKGTTSSLIVSILKAARKRVHFGGNIGIPMFSFIDKVRPGDYVVLELSSFQLEDLETSPHIAVVTNFSRDHLKSADPLNPNHHKSMRDYWRAKENICLHQRKGDFLIVNEKIADKIPAVSSRVIRFGKSRIGSSLVGEHNKENIAAAEAVTRLCGVGDAAIKKAVGNFKGLVYRIQHIGHIEGVDYYNDSFATTPDAAITAMKSFERPMILLAGGADKGSSFAAMAREIKKRVKSLVLFKGEGSDKIEAEMLKIGYPSGSISRARDMAGAMKIAKKRASKGDIVLLSAGCASFGSFKNYKQRGRLFTEEVLKIKNHEL